MKKIVCVATLASLALLGGCRREDIREVTIELPKLTEADKAKVMDAFVSRKKGQADRIYEGIFTDTFQFDFSKKTLTMKYDSMKIAQTNIRMLIQDKGVEVLFPSNTTGVAGYLDVKPESTSR